MSWNMIKRGSVRFPIPSEWTSSLERSNIYEGTDGQVDVRSSLEGYIIDSARLDETLGRLPAAYEGVVVLVGGRSALRLRSFEQKSLIYMVSEPPSGTRMDVRYTEMRAVYRFTGDAFEAQIGAIIDQFEDSDDERLTALNQHRKSKDGHLEFGPFRVPPGWGVETESGLVPLPASAADRLYLGGGFAMLRDLSDERQYISFEPLPVLGETLDDQATAFVGGLSKDAVGSSIKKTVAHSPAIGGRVTELELAGSDGSIVRSYIWFDVLGYPWSLSLSCRDPAADMRAGFGAAEWK